MSSKTRSSNKRSSRSKSAPQLELSSSEEEGYDLDNDDSDVDEDDTQQGKKPAAKKLPAKKQKTATKTKPTNKAGRKTDSEKKRNDLAGQKTCPMYLRIGLYEITKTNKSTKKPKQWPDRSAHYTIIRMPEIPSSIDQLYERMQTEIADKYDDKFEVNNENGVGRDFVFANEAGANSSFESAPLVNEELKGKKRFYPIACDATLDFAIKNYSTVVEVEEPCNDADKSEDDSDSASTLSSRVAVIIDRLLLDLVVFVSQKKAPLQNDTTQPKKKKSKKSDYDTIKIELLPLVEKSKEGEPVTEKERIVGSFRLSKTVFDSYRYGTLRYEIAQQAVKKKIDGYVSIPTDDDSNSETTLFFGDRSAIYLAEVLRGKGMTKMLKMDDVKEAIEKRAGMDGVTVVNQRKTVTIKLALGKMHPSDTAYDHEQDDTDNAVLDESQDQDRFDSPMQKSSNKKGSSRAAAESLHEETSALINKLYRDPGTDANSNPYFHGLTARMAALLRSRFQDKKNRDAVKEVLDRGEMPSILCLFGLSLKATDRQPERNKYPPDAGGRPPVVIEQESTDAIGSLSNSFSRFVDAQIAGRTNTATPNPVPNIGSTLMSFNNTNTPVAGPRVFRFKRDQVKVDVEWDNVKRSASTNGFTGEDVWALAKEQDRAGVFKVPKEQKQLVKDAKADVYLELAQHSNLQILKDVFESKSMNELQQYFGDQHETVEFEIKIIERPSYASDMSDL